MTVALRRAVRLARIVLHLLAGLLVWTPAAALSRQPQRYAQSWFRGVARILNLKITVEGQASPRPVLLAGNHISWLDIAVVVAVRPVIFVSKAEVARWPVIGWMARAGGTRFIERGAHGTAALNREIAGLLAQGHSVVIFPEGTTTRGDGVRPFQPRLFAGAIETRTPVQPFALQYREACAPYVGDDVMAWNLMRLLREPQLTAHLSFGPELPPGEHRKAIASQVQRWVSARIAAGAPWSDADRLRPAA